MDETVDDLYRALLAERYPPEPAKRRPRRRRRTPADDETDLRLANEAANEAAGRDVSVEAMRRASLGW